jgi:predicted nucleotidyltransferase
MTNDKEILQEIKKTIELEIPDGKIFLFGSRVSGKVHDESDWDILILTQKKYSKEMRWKIQEELFSLNLKYNTYIDITLVQEYEWNNNPAYYSLKLDISMKKSIIAI